MRSHHIPECPAVVSVRIEARYPRPEAIQSSLGTRRGPHQRIPARIQEQPEASGRGTASSDGDRSCVPGASQAPCRERPLVQQTEREDMAGVGRQALALHCRGCHRASAGTTTCAIEIGSSLRFSCLWRSGVAHGKLNHEPLSRFLFKTSDCLPASAEDQRDEKRI